MAFDPHDEPLEEAGRRALELFVDFYRGLESRRVAPDPQRVRELARDARDTLGDAGTGLLPVLEEVARTILPASMATPHPLYLGLVNSSPFPAAVLGDLLVSALNNNGAVSHQSPAITVLEQEVVRSFVELFGLPQGSSGMIVPGGSLATLQAVVLARTRHFPDWHRQGPRATAGEPRLYTSESAHFSVARAAQVAGIGQQGVVTIPGTGRGAVDVAALAQRIAGDRREGAVPFAVVATAGTTGTGAIDALSEIAGVCEEHRLWLHVDACYGGAAVLLEELRPCLAGLERADSVAVDPHKWFFVPIAASLLLTPHADLETETFAAGDTSYVPASPGGETEAFLRGIVTSRRSSGLPVWMALRAYGWNAVREAVRRNIALTRLLERLLAAGGFTVLPDGQLSVACARWERAGGSAAEIDRLQEEIVADVVASGKAWFSTVRHDRRTWLRFNLVNLYTRERHVRELAEVVITTAVERGG